MPPMTRSWSEIRRTYDGYNQEHSASILNLVDAIEQSRYAVGLFPWTSMADLCIAQTPAEYPYSGPYLRIRPTPDGKLLEFSYIDTPRKTEQWNRIVPAQEGFNRLERFIEQLHWFGN